MDGGTEKASGSDTIATAPILHLVAPKELNSALHVFHLALQEANQPNSATNVQIKPDANFKCGTTSTNVHWVGV